MYCLLVYPKTKCIFFFEYLKGSMDTDSSCFRYNNAYSKYVTRIVVPRVYTFAIIMPTRNGTALPGSCMLFLRARHVLMVNAIFT